jgi:two-component sensor histidine kinase
MLTKTTMRVLIVEDDVMIHESVKSLVTRLGYTVAGSAYDGPSAIEMACRLKPDIILLDIVMPDPETGLDDRQAGLRAAVEILSNCPTPIILLTSYESPDLVAQASRIGVGAYLVKPPRPGDVERAIAVAWARFADLQELRRLNARLEWLVRDTYHRVKNNLMVVESLLYLQANCIDDPVVRDLFTESKTRVKTMLLIHEKLHLSQDLTQIEFSSYIRDLISDLFYTYRPVGVTIDLVVDVQDIFLSADMATSCGLIINELISNALKHAFNNRQEGKLWILLYQERDTCILTVGDDGIGLPQGFDFRNTDTLGMQIVTLGVGQLQGTLELVSSHGTTWKVTFKV